jgi:nucleoside-diphosphate-sugar epimerase
VFNGRRFQHDFGWQPAIQLREGIRGEVAWYRATGSRNLEPNARERAPAA